MEHKIGEIITLPDGRKAEIIEQDTCIGCIFLKNGCDILRGRGIIPECASKHRTDHKNVIYKEVKEE